MEVLHRPTWRLTHLHCVTRWECVSILFWISLFWMMQERVQQCIRGWERSVCALHGVPITQDLYLKLTDVTFISPILDISSVVTLQDDVCDALVSERKGCMEWSESPDEFLQVDYPPCKTVNHNSLLLWLCNWFIATLCRSLHGGVDITAPHSSLRIPWYCQTCKQWGDTFLEQSLLKASAMVPNPTSLLTSPSPGCFRLNSTCRVTATRHLSSPLIQVQSKPALLSTCPSRCRHVKSNLSLKSLHTIPMLFMDSALIQPNTYLTHRLKPPPITTA